MPNADQGQAQQPHDAAGGDAPEKQTDINAAVNSAVASQLKRALPKALAEGLAPALETALAPLREQFAKLQPPAPGASGESGTAKVDRPADKGAASESPAIVELRAQLAAQAAETATLKKKLTDSERETARQRRVAVEEKGFGAVRNALAGKVKPEAVAAVTDLLRARGAIVIDDEGTPRLKVRASLETGLPVEDHELPFADALPHWLKTQEAALFTPSPSSGAGGPKRPQPITRASGANGATTTTGSLGDAFAEQTGMSLDKALG